MGITEWVAAEVPDQCDHRNGAIDWDTGAWHCHDCGAYVA